jgi:hypothetical protein
MLLFNFFRIAASIIVTVIVLQKIENKRKNKRIFSAYQQFQEYEKLKKLKL